MKKKIVALLSAMKTQLSLFSGTKKKTKSENKSHRASANGVYEITYTNKLREKSKRTIRLNQIYKSESQELYVSGYCELRKENRTFLTSAIHSAVRTSDGLLIDNPTEYFTKCLKESLDNKLVS